jgi:hypothetical protein
VKRTGATWGAIALLLTLLAAPARAGADPILQSKRLWATVNVCDTTAHPDAIGIRGSMPGSGDRSEDMFMRFQIQYMTPADGRWHNLASGGDSGFVRVGAASARARELGRTFTIAPPPATQTSYVLRGVVTFEWRDDGDVVRSARKSTTAGHADTAGSDPAGASAATCQIA